MGELEILRSVRARGGRSRDVRVGIGDDCAVLRPVAGEELVVTTDLTLEGRHFRDDWHTPESVGHRCLARGLSDVAAMGARPVAVFVSLACPAKKTRGRARSWLDRFYDGLLKLAGEHGVPLAGGDLSEYSVTMADITVVGAVKQGRALLRSGARAGDGIYVSGTLGGAAAELQLLAAGERRKSRGAHPHLFPEPRMAVGRALVARGLASAAMDISDGLSTDLEHLCEESGTGAVVAAGLVPVDGLAGGAGGSGLELALHGGEDYELLFTARPGVKVPGAIAGVAVTRIGEMVALRKGAPRLRLERDGRLEPLVRRGWEHFAG